MDEIARLRQRGLFRAVYDASARGVAELGAVGAHPFRERGEGLNVAARWHDHGRAAWQAARFAEAEGALDRAYAIRCEALGAAHVDALDTLERLAAVSAYQLRYDVADARFTAAIGGLARALGDEHVRVGIARRNHAASLRARGLLHEARALLERARAALEPALSAEHPDWVDLVKVDAFLALLERDTAGAVRRADNAAALGARCWEADHPYVAAAELTAARAETQLGHARPARKRLVRIARTFADSYGPAHPLVALTWSAHARLELREGDDLELAEDLARRAITTYCATYPGRSATVIVLVLHAILVARGDLAGAAALAERVEPDATDAERRRLWAELANALTRRGEHAHAVPWLVRIVDSLDDGELREKWQVALRRAEASARR